MRFSIHMLVIFFVSQAAVGQTAREIIDKAENLIKGETSQGIFKMTIVTPNYTREMEMESTWKGNEKALITIRSPRREAGNKTLKVGNEMWMYLRNTETTIKIPPSMMMQSWNGSDFTNDDIVRESNLVDDYSMSIIGEEEIDDELCWKIELVPRPDLAIVWGKLHYWVRQKDYIATRIEYFDEHGEMMRYMDFTDIQEFDSRMIPGRWIMYNRAKTGHRTEFEIVDIAFDVRVSDRVFSLQELER
jgi:outer membrane lipoprotein-sorting protein